MKIKRLILASLLATIVVLSVVMPVWAIANPDSITMPRYDAFANVYETGDMLFECETKVVYAVPPADASTLTFAFQVLDAAGVVIFGQQPLFAYQNKLASYYFSAAQVTALGLVKGTQYKLRITGTPAYFPVPVEGTSMVTSTLSAGFPSASWIDESGVPITQRTQANDALIMFNINIAKDLQTYDSPASPYWTTVQGADYLTQVGTSLFLQGVPFLMNYVPQLFQSGSTNNYVSPVPTSGAGQTNLTTTNQLGANIANAITNMGAFLGFGPTMAGFALTFFLMIICSIVVYAKVQHPVAPLAVSIVILVVGGYLGMITLSILFAFAIVMVLLLLWFFFSRGYI